MEPIIVIVGFLGAGKTTLLQKLVKSYCAENWSPSVILNDYENASIDAQKFLNFMEEELVSPLSGSCICCSGLPELRNQVNSFPRREKAITLIEANGTTDACSLLGFLGVGLNSYFLPPIQIAVVDVKGWQNRGYNNDLEKNQVQMSSLIVLNHLEEVSSERINEVKNDLKQCNPYAAISTWGEFDADQIVSLEVCQNIPTKIQHVDTHWSSCSIDLPDPFSSLGLLNLLEALPKNILRIKACTKLDADDHYSFIEKTPTGETFVKPYTGKLVSGPKLVAIGPGSDPKALEKLVREQVHTKNSYITSETNALD